MKPIPFDRYLWLLNLLYSTGGLSKAEINRRWRNQDSDKRKSANLPDSTFYHWIQMIHNQWGLDVVYNKAKDKYVIENLDESNKFLNWMMRSIAVTELLLESSTMRDRILLEAMPSGEKWLGTIIRAMRENKVVDMSYKPFEVSIPHVMEFKPYCLKTFKQRWYMVGESSNHKGEIRVYALDRVVAMEEMEKEFRLPKNFDGEKLFWDLYGVWLGTDLKVETVRVMVKASEANYLRTLPLHHSQKELGPSKEEGWIEFEWYIKPTYDFVMELRSRGKNLKVLKSDIVKKEISK